MRGRSTLGLGRHRPLAHESDDDKVVVGEMFDAVSPDEIAAIEIDLGATTTRCQGAE